MVYDKRYDPYFRRCGLLAFVLNFKNEPPVHNSTAITALLDRWRPETHTFHLPLGEMTITLEDMAMISGLPIDGRALTGKVLPQGWKQRVRGLIGVEPEPWTNPNKKDPRSNGVLYSWIREHRVYCPHNVQESVVEHYARAYLWHLLTLVVFPDCSGDTASWMYLDPLRDWDVQWSWGTAALAFLYRQVKLICICINVYVMHMFIEFQTLTIEILNVQLDEACRRTRDNSNLGGFVWALQIWMWERLPVGRPISKKPQEEWEWDFDGEAERFPTIAYTWANVDVFTAPSMGRYKSYINELDTLTHHQVIELS